MSFLSGRTSLTTVQAADIATGAITTAKLADNVVTLAKMASGTDGNLIGIDANGDPAYIATGSAGQVLTSGGAGVASAMATTASGGWTFVSENNVSSAASVAFTSLATGFDYKVTGANVEPATNGGTLEVELGVTGPTYRTSNYTSPVWKIDIAGGDSAIFATDHIDLHHVGRGDQTDEEGPIEITFLDPAATTQTNWYGLAEHTDNGGTPQQVLGWPMGHYNTAEAHTAIKFAMSTGNIQAGLFRLYKRANA
jgi:hypothetical protein